MSESTFSTDNPAFVLPGTYPFDPEPEQMPAEAVKGTDEPAEDTEPGEEETEEKDAGESTAEATDATPKHVGTAEPAKSAQQKTQRTQKKAQKKTEPEDADEYWLEGELEELTVAELRDVADANDIPLASHMLKAEIVDAIMTSDEDD